jgi:hypothetical protein
MQDDPIGLDPKALEAEVWISELDLQFLSKGNYREAKVFNYPHDHRVPLYTAPRPAVDAGVVEALIEHMVHRLLLPTPPGDGR